MAAAPKSTPHHVDVYVGERVRRLRSMRKITQQGLAEALGISFQQVQKYEKGTNRISVSKLYEIKQALGARLEDFYVGLDEETDKVAVFAESPSPEYKMDIGNSREGAELIEAFLTISNPTLRRQVLALVKSIAADPDRSG